MKLSFHDMNFNANSLFQIDVNSVTFCFVERFFAVSPVCFEALVFSYVVRICLVMLLGYVSLLIFLETLCCCN